MKNAASTSFVDWLLANCVPFETDNPGIKASRTRLIRELRSLMKQVETPREFRPRRWDTDSYRLIAGTGKRSPSTWRHTALSSLIGRRFGMDGPAFEGYLCLQPKHPIVTAEESAALFDLFLPLSPEGSELARTWRPETEVQLEAYFSWLGGIEVDEDDDTRSLTPRYRVQLREMLLRFRLGDLFTFNASQNLFRYDWHNGLAPVGLRDWKILIART